VERNVHTGFEWKTCRRRELGRPRSGWENNTIIKTVIFTIERALKFQRGSIPLPFL
jgi:hypothetical protein